MPADAADDLLSSDHIRPLLTRPFLSLSSHSPTPAAAPTMSIGYRQYMGESDLPHIMALVQHELSEPYVIYTYRYFLHQWYAFVAED